MQLDDGVGKENEQKSRYKSFASHEKEILNGDRFIVVRKGSA